MSSVAPSLSRPQPPQPDPFAIGWRDVPRRLADGTVVNDRIPLTLEDALHPQEGDVIVQNSVHNRNWRYLEQVCELQTRDDPTALVLADCKVQWDVRDLEYHSPDISVIFGVRHRRERWSVFDVAVEGVRPLMLMEIVSPSTRINDVITKVQEYHRAGVRYYVIVDQETEDGPLKLIGYSRTPRRYLPMPVDEQGRLWLEPLRCWLAVTGSRVVCYDGETETELGDYLAVSNALATAQAQAEQEKRRADQENQRAERLAAQLRALGIEPEA
jgi:Uma2 family endonuclease